jgi:tight adherence protein B
MSTYAIIYLFTFLAAAAVVAGVWHLVWGSSGDRWEERLQTLTEADKGDGEVNTTILNRDALQEGQQGLSALVHDVAQRFADFNSLLPQAGMSISAANFLLCCLGCGLAGFTGVLLARRQIMLAPLVAIGSASVPLLWVLFRRRRRLKQFAVQLPDALQLIARALRAGISLQLGLRSVADEMLPPISGEFMQLSESIALGIPVEQALAELVRRAPNKELQFFATAVTMQRQMGGNLAEALDKIAGIVRERFKILGQVQSLTGEGRISGVVLMVLPVVLFFVLYWLNEEYVMILFTDQMGRKMLAAAVVLQLFGAVVIKKIVDIDV